MDALTTPNKTFFLSYSRRQIAWCDDLYTAIDTHTHYQRWRDNKIPESADWWDTICHNIEGCYAFVAILSKDYLRSAYCIGELRYALRLKKPVIALMLEDVKYPKQLDEMRLQFARVDGLDMRDVINKVLNATNQVTLDYATGKFSTDISPRPHLRPSVPTPKANAEDKVLQEQISHAESRLRTTDILPDPFIWIPIPDRDYSISKYPVTNAQFAKFIDEDGYQNEAWWSSHGWTIRQANNWREPRYWQDSQWNGDLHPVVGVSWYESVAFCLWLSDVTGESIMLPTEDQWQYAAQGDDGRRFPWGDDWNGGDCCNNALGGHTSNGTTPVTKYGVHCDSPFGVVDMVGNVWEWCLTDYENKTNHVNKKANARALRGGSWVNDGGSGFFTCAFRVRGVPARGRNSDGFRIVRNS